ncbi:MAG: XkdF-like putative serine protease domain-containing protein [Ignavibacteriaceae bacterium]
MPDKKRFLKKVTVNFISLVDKAANMKRIIFKSADCSNPPVISVLEEEKDYYKTISIAKYDEDQRIVYGIVYSPDEADTDGDFTSAEVIKQMAYEFMKSRNTNNVDQQHDYTADEGYIAESWLLEKNDPRFPGEPEGSWAVGIKVTNNATWQKVKAGEITGLSMAGIAVVEEVPGFIKNSAGTEQDSMIYKISRIIKEGINAIKKDYHNKTNNNKNKEDDMTREEITTLVKSTVSEAAEPFNELQKSVNGLKDLVESKSAEIEKRLKNVEEASPGSSQFITNEEIFRKDKSYKGPAWLS